MSGTVQTIPFSFLLFVPLLDSIPMYGRNSIYDTEAFHTWKPCGSARLHASIGQCVDLSLGDTLQHVCAARLQSGGIYTLVLQGGRETCSISGRLIEVSLPASWGVGRQISTAVLMSLDFYCIGWLLGYSTSVLYCIVLCH